MAIIAFPPVTTAHEYGVLAYGGDLEVESLVLAYESGIFPWPHPKMELLWFAPPVRGILKITDFHISKSFARVIKKHDYQFHKNKNFAEVIKKCAKVPRVNQPGTWITKNMIAAYTDLHQAGFADSYEIYQNDQLVGGLYGVRIKNFFAAESMFHLADNASKLAIYELVEDLKQQGISWFDCQMLNPFLEKLGVTEIPREEYMQLLTKQLS